MQKLAVPSGNAVLFHNNRLLTKKKIVEKTPVGLDADKRPETGGSGAETKLLPAKSCPLIK